MKKTKTSTLFFLFSLHARKGLALAGFALMLTLTACSSLGVESEAKYKDKQHEDIYKHGSVASDKGGFTLLGGDEKKTAENGLGVNGFLWRATLDTLSFLPIASADPFGGVITTDWHAGASTPDERTKLNVLILDRELRADGVKVTVFRQTKGKDGQWIDAPVSPSTASSLEETILTRARQLRLAKRQEK